MRRAHRPRRADEALKSRRVTLAKPPPGHASRAPRTSGSRGLTRGSPGAADWDVPRLQPVLTVLRADLTRSRRLARVLVPVAVAALVLSLGALTAGATQVPDDTVSIESLTPASGTVGTEIAYSLAGTDEAGSQQCATSSAYRLEFLNGDGTLETTGGETVAVPPTAKTGDSFVRLVCYVPDATARRVIHGLCAGFLVIQTGEAASGGDSGAAVACPATPRLVLGQSVIAVERAMSEAFNPNLFYPLTK